MVSERKRADASDYLAHYAHPPNPSTDPNDVEGRERRRENYDALANDFYDNATDFYLEGWGSSFHFCRYPRGREPMTQAMARHEHYMAASLGLAPGMKVLDVGCGIGGPAREIVAFSGCEVTGVNVNAHQVEVGRKWEGGGGVELVVADFMNLPFADNTFDAIYAIEATVHAPSLHAVYTEIHRVLKPGGRFGVYEWVMTDAFSADDPRHLYLRSGIERGNGIACIRTAAEASDAMKRAGFELEIAEDLAVKQKDELPWWYFCDGDTRYAQGVADWLRIVRMTKPGRVGLNVFIKLLELVGVARKGTAKMAKEMIHGGDCIAKAGKRFLFTPMYFMVGKKVDLVNSVG